MDTLRANFTGGMLKDPPSGDACTFHPRNLFTKKGSGADFLEIVRPCAIKHALKLADSCGANVASAAPV